MIDVVRSLLSLDPYLAPFYEVFRSVKQLDQSSKEYLISECDSALQRVAIRASEANRVLIAKTLVASLPESGGIVEYWLNKRSGKHVYEVHFSLFCFLDKVQEMNLPQERARIEKLTQGYLANVNSEASQAAWMAGDLLGDHWPINESLPILIELAMQAKFSAGRKGAIHGLAHLLSRLKDDNKKKRKINRLLRKISEDDADEGVKEYAAFALRGLKL